MHRYHVDFAPIVCDRRDPVKTDSTPFLSRTALLGSSASTCFDYGETIVPGPAVERTAGIMREEDDR